MYRFVCAILLVLASSVLCLIRPRSLESYPYVASLLHKGRHYCSGSIVDDRIILTAADCIAGDYDYNDIVVSLGSINKADGDHYQVQQIITPNIYVPELKLNDFGILLLEKNITYSRTVKKIRMADRDQVVPDGTIATLCGWGKKNHDRNIIDTGTVLASPVKLINLDACKATFGKDLEIYNTSMCAVGHKNMYKSGDCFGDVGSPLVLLNEQIGILYAGKGCGRGYEDYPGIYTNVAAIRKFFDVMRYRALYTDL